MTSIKTEIEALWADNTTEDVSQPYLQLALGNKHIAALPMENAKEVLLISSQRITQVPNMSDCILGLINQRSRVFWVVDLPYMLGMQPISNNQQNYHLAIIRSSNISLGLVVSQVQGVMRLTREEIQSPVGNVSPGLVPYLQGCTLQKDKIILILDAEAIIDSPYLYSES
ncbi:MAG TPA: chemotaxis protein CheW [Xenococcaceae cyanobacterium]